MTDPKALHKRGKNNASAGYYAINPNGHLVLVPPLAPLKPGWSLATQADLNERAQLEAERREGDPEWEARGRQAAYEAEVKAATEAASTPLTFAQEPTPSAASSDDPAPAPAAQSDQ